MILLLGDKSTPESSSYEVIDGLQRLTTMTLFFAAIQDIIKETLSGYETNFDERLFCKSAKQGKIEQKQRLVNNSLEPVLPISILNLNNLKGDGAQTRPVSYEQDWLLSAFEYIKNLLNKEKIIIGEGIFRLDGIVTKNDTWCGEYDLQRELDNLDTEAVDFYEEVNLKIVNPILINKKSIFGFERILEIILENVKNEVEFEMEGLKESILNSITVKRELYREKRVDLLNNEIKKAYLGDIEIVLQGYYGQMLLSFLQYVKYAGVGEFRECGFGEMIIRN